jgi:hypothetical protein
MENQYEFNMYVELFCLGQILISRWLATTAHSNKLAIDLKNAPAMLQVSEEQTAALVGAFDFNVIESCVSLPFMLVHA